MVRRSLAGAVLAAGLIPMLGGCASATDTLHAECREAVAGHVGVDVAEVLVDWTHETPGGALDWRGTYPGGEFACAASLNPNQLHSVMIYADDGAVESVLR